MGIIFMIMGHIGFGYLFDKWIHGFHMPMFFFISGWFYKHYDLTFGNALKRKAISLLVPYFSIGFIELIFCYLTMNSYYGWNPLQQFLFSNTSGLSPVPGALWFLTAMFFSDLIYILLDKICSSKALNILIIAVSIFGMIQVWILRYRLPWAIDAGCVGAGFIHIGRLWRSSSLNKLMSLPLWKTVFLGVIVSASILICPYVNMRTATYGLYPMFWINALAAIIVGWNFSRYILQAFKKLKDNV